MLFAAFPRQPDLFLTLPKPDLVAVRCFVDAVMAGNAMLVFRALAVLGKDRAAATMAQFMWPFDQPVAYGHAVVEHKTLSLPCTVLGRDFLEVSQDSAFEVIHFVYALAEQEVGGFLAANSTGAEHCNALVVKTLLVLCPPGGKISEAFRFRVHRAFECSDGNFVIISGIYHGHVGAADQLIPILGFNVIANAGPRIHVGLTHCHDLFFETDLHPSKGRMIRAGFLPFQIGTAG